MDGIKALFFDTGGTILDWHTGISRKLAELGSQHGEARDWGQITNDYRLRTLLKMTGGAHDFRPGFNMDDVLKSELEAVIKTHDLGFISDADKDEIFLAWHSLPVWPDVPTGLNRIRSRYTAASLTILSVKMIIATCKPNDIIWDAVFSCETIGSYKPRAEPYQKAAHWMQLEPSECLMVAAHLFDLEAASKAGLRTVYVPRPEEWGPGEPPGFTESSYQPDFAVDDFNALATKLNCD